MCKQLILASQSPRRRELLSQLGYQFSCQGADLDESVHENELPEVYVERLAREKVQHVLKLQSLSQNLNQKSAVVLGADTSVVYKQQILGKPENKADCLAMLDLLSDRKHQVFTSIAVGVSDKIISRVIVTDVYFKPLTHIEIERYWQTGEPQDKAGAYGIQGIGGQFVKHIQGSYSAVVGLPLYETANLLAEFDMPTVIQSNAQFRENLK
ncbi:MAG: septum formation inhibitor Maf [Alteromonadaceae bacterium]|nr:septum formation inhibitor Maf [Alteromonadaceae bacterium]